jgi:hypothetical protein
VFAGLIDDAAVFPPGSSPLPEAVASHHRHRAAWYADLVGPLLVPASALPDLPGVPPPLAIGVIGDTGIDGLFAAVDTATDALTIRQVEVAVAKRGEDPLPGLRALLARLADRPHLQGYAEIPLTWGLHAALDTVAERRATGALIVPKFRTGGLAAELFPTAAELAAVICACRDRDLPFKLTAGLHHAVRHTDPETGFTHHGFLNILVASVAAAGGARPEGVAELLSSTDPVPLIEAARASLDRRRPLWIGFGTCSVLEPLDDLQRFGLLGRGAA